MYSLRINTVLLDFTNVSDPDFSVGKLSGLKLTQTWDKQEHSPSSWMNFLMAVGVITLFNETSGVGACLVLGLVLVPVTNFVKESTTRMEAKETVKGIGYCRSHEHQ